MPESMQLMQRCGYVATCCEWTFDMFFLRMKSFVSNNVYDVIDNELSKVYKLRHIAYTQYIDIIIQCIRTLYYGV